MTADSTNTATDRGSGIVGMSFGLLFFFIFLVFAVQVTYNLYATSVMTSLALDAARDVAERDGLTIAEATAEFREHVGPEAQFSLVDNGDTVVATIEWETKSLLPALSDARAFGVLDRSFVVRVEEQQDP